jgi:hypothetical protein
MAYGRVRMSALRCCSGGRSSAPIGAEREAMNALKSQTFRIVMFLSALASSSLVLMAGRRWD